MVARTESLFRLSPSGFHPVALLTLCLCLIFASLSDFVVSFLPPAEVEVLSSAIADLVFVLCGRDILCFAVVTVEVS